MKSAEEHIHKVTYFDTDRKKRLKLSRWFAIFQEIAIQHAEKYNIGAVADGPDNPIWVINRLKCRFNKYPDYQDKIVAQTWSTGIKGFKGYREFAAFQDDLCIAKASSLWLRIDLARKTFSKLSKDIIAQFPVSDEPPAFPEVEKTKIAIDLDQVKKSWSTITRLRYDDVDSNQHVNNTVYFNVLQTALQEAQLKIHPHEIFIHFQTEIDAACHQIEIILAETEDRYLFQIKNDDTSHAAGYVLI